MRRWTTASALLCLTTLSALLACRADDVTGPPLTVLAGSYTAEGPFGAITFTTSTADGDDETDWLAQGASIVLELADDGTTGGRLFVPGGDEDGGDMDEDLTGTWSVEDGVVTLAHDADTFLRDMPFASDGDRLEGEETFGDMTIRVVLIRR